MVLGELPAVRQHFLQPGTQQHHSLGAAGGIEAIFSILALRDQVVPPTINLDNQDPQCDLDYVPNEARQSKLSVTMSNSFGFGGTNGTLVFRTV